MLAFQRVDPSTCAPSTVRQIAYSPYQHEIRTRHFRFSWCCHAMIERSESLARIKAALRRSRVVALVGPRQCGKTTLARQILPAASDAYFDLEGARCGTAR